MNSTSINIEFMKNTAYMGLFLWFSVLFLYVIEKIIHYYINPKSISTKLVQNVNFNVINKLIIIAQALLIIDYIMTIFAFLFSGLSEIKIEHLWVTICLAIPWLFLFIRLKLFWKMLIAKIETQ